jgi:hypothetical protein
MKVITTPMTATRTNMVTIMVNTVQKGMDKSITELRAMALKDTDRRLKRHLKKLAGINLHLKHHPMKQARSKHLGWIHSKLLLRKFRLKHLWLPRLLSLEKICQL